MVAAWTNNLFYGCNLSFYQETIPGYFPFTLTSYNNLFRLGPLSFVYRDNSTTWTIKDNLFDCDTLTIHASTSTAASNNGYRSGLNSLGGSGNKTGLAPDYQTGPLGNFYYPTNGTNLFTLIDAGSRNATNASLYHRTTQLNQTPESNSLVDIGFHYVAVAPNGNPIDSDGDGLADYLEDRNGDGAVDSAETSWQSATDLELKVWITEPKSNSNIP